MTECDNCTDTITGTQLIYQKFNSRDPDNLLHTNYIFCDKTCLNQWKWNKYYNYIEITT